MTSVANGLIDVEDLYRSLDPDEQGTAVSVIVKLRGETCDIDCLYCYEKRKEAPSGRRIDADQISRLADIFGDRPLAIELHGGEPLTIGKPAMAEILRTLAATTTIVKVSMQTNAVALDDEWLDLFDAEYPAIRIGVSLDGDAAGNDWRVGYDGQPVYPRVAAALKLLAKRGRHVGIIAAVTPAVLGRAAAVIDHLASFEAVNAVKFAPCFDSTIRHATAGAGRTTASRAIQRQAVSADDGPAWAVTPAEYAEFVLAVASRWIHAGHFRRISLEPVVSTIRRIRGLNSGFCHFSDMKCQHVFTLYPDGRFGACDELPWPQAQLGILPRIPTAASVAAAQTRSPLMQQLKLLMTKCVSCDYRQTCAGGCLATRNRLENAEDDEAYCAHRTRLIDGVAALLAAPADPEAVLCRTLQWRPQEINQMRDVEAFLSRWNSADAPRTEATLLVSPYGNINTVGAPGTHEADDLDPLHPQWDAAIEPGVKPLVTTAVGVWGCATYDSCEGHRYQGLEIEPRARQLGILPRDAAEYRSVANALCRVAKAVEGSLPGAVRLTAARADLGCEAGGRRYPVLDLRLEPSGPGVWDDYFADLDAATNLVEAAMRITRPNGTNPCCCTPLHTRSAR